MLVREKTGIAVVLMAAVCFLGGCAGKGFPTEPAAASEKPVEQVNRLEKDIDNGRDKQLNVLAPTWFSKAEISLYEAKKGLELEDELSDILKNVTYGRAHLQRAQEAGNVAREEFPDVIEARDLARAAGAANMGEDYVKAEEQFLELTRAIEKDNLRWARKNRAKVVRAFDELELRAIKGVLGEVRKLINEGEKSGAGKITPNTFKAAQDRLRDVDVFISEHRYQKEEIHEQVNEALFQARRLLQVLQQSKRIQTMEPEQITLWFEGMLYNTAAKLSTPDMRDHAFEVQVENILASVAALQKDHEFMVRKVKRQQADLEYMQVQIAALEGKMAALEGKTRQEQAAKERLAAERQFQQLFSEVQDSFSPDEAEVYKQGNRLVIRLRGIQFPVGKAFILPGNYALLSKVQRAIRTFAEPEVVIEGHTDSTGSEALNQDLSERRAEAVRQYFVANGTLTYDEISAIGYGSEQPLASNKTPEGRAINRRIDVIIMPQLKKGK
ncbi:MAG TPA: OmpA family protein [Desulfatiglandales bacterium]|nr:OmpA family protein [Desulfatiglandales bacterium]